jgi:hypothetical protein
MDGPLAADFASRLASSPQAAGVMSPHPSSRMTKLLINLEESYYARIVLPELLVVFLVNPEIAVQRKTDENPVSVRERSKEIWELDWKHTDAHIIDTSQSKADVLSELKALVWSEL